MLKCDRCKIRVGGGFNSVSLKKIGSDWVSSFEEWVEEIGAVGDRRNGSLGGLVVRSRLRRWRVPGSKPDSIKDPLFHVKSYIVAKRPPVGVVRKFEEGCQLGVVLVI
ncbi:hypothetical protein AVEN_229638-1 [Araneus ventricosus]|uniref:Uncharacterized protein n=1 Tax=Araneus ventricosus TaxID=182803 RepID=A0A4Y2HVU0_ARAVE|nr:hypothetical protein AVEN_229638-1 [Araneus ventricosus]